MARGTTLTELVQQLKLETNLASEAHQSQSIDAEYKNLLRRVQESLYHSHDWPHLIIDSDEPMVAGSRYYSFQSDINFDRVLSAKVKWEDEWYPVYRGIDEEVHFAITDSEADERDSPVKRWDFYTSGVGLDQFEVWPIPNADAQTLRFRAVRNLGPLVDGNDLAELDDRLIVTSAAYEVFASRNNRTMAELMLSNAVSMKRTLIGNQSKDDLNMSPRRNMSGRRPTHPVWAKRI